MNKGLFLVEVLEVKSDSNAVVGRILGESPNITSFYPIDTTNQFLPKVNELVLGLQFPDLKYSTVPVSNRYYYLPFVISVNQTLNNNQQPKPTSYDITRGKDISDKYVTSVLPNLAEGISNNISEGDSKKSVQLKDKEKVLQGAYGSSIVFSDGPTLKLTNNNQSEKLDSRKDGSILYLSKGRIPSSIKTPVGFTSPSTYNKDQIFLSSKKITLASNEDHVILSSKKDIGLSTGKWNASLNEVLDILDGLVNELANIGSGVSQIIVAGAPSTGASNFVQLNQLRAKILKLKF